MTRFKYALIPTLYSNKWWGCTLISIFLSYRRISKRIQVIEEG